METTAINRDLELLLETFKTTINNCFSDKGIDIVITNIDFSITKPVDNAKLFAEGAATVPVITASCKPNKQGQIVCS